MKKLSRSEREEIELAYKAGERSVRFIANQYHITEIAIRRAAKKHGWVRSAPDIKRRIVSDAMAGVSQGMSHDAVRQSQSVAAELDIADMERGLRINRNCLISLEAASQTATDPKELKVIVEAATAAITSIRKIRGLDESTPIAGKDVKVMTDEELAKVISCG